MITLSLIISANSIYSFSITQNYCAIAPIITYLVAPSPTFYLDRSINKLVRLEAQFQLKII